MATKCITITTEAYERLTTVKSDYESFSDVIIKHFPKHSLLELAGVLSDKEAKELKETISRLRKTSRKRLERVAEALQ